MSIVLPGGEVDGITQPTLAIWIGHLAATRTHDPNRAERGYLLRGAVDGNLLPERERFVRGTVSTMGASDAGKLKNGEARRRPVDLGGQGPYTRRVIPFRGLVRGFGMTIHLKPEQEDQIAEAVRSGAYQSPDDVIERALEVLHERDEWLIANRRAVDAKILRGMKELDRGEGIRDDQLDAHLKALKAQAE